MISNNNSISSSSNNPSFIAPHPLKCSICKDFYKNPVLLNSCKHSFCLCCLERSEKNIVRLFELPKKSNGLISSDNTNSNSLIVAQEVKEQTLFDCPICQTKDQPYTDNIEIEMKLKTYHEEESKKGGGESVVCQGCEENPAKVTCMQCKMSFCDGCNIDIHSRGAFRSHTSGPLQLVKSPLFCEEHKGKEIEAVCLNEKNEKILLCSLCSFQGKQKNFKVFILSDFEKESLEKSNKKLDELIPIFDQSVQSLGKITDGINQTVSEVEKNKIQIKEKITEIFDERIKELERRKIELLGEVEDYRRQKEKKLKKQKHIVEDLKKEAEGLMKKREEMKNKTNQNFLQLEELQQKMEEFKKSLESFKAMEICQNSFFETEFEPENETIKHLTQNFGKIQMKEQKEKGINFIQKQKENIQQKEEKITWITASLSEARWNLVVTSIGKYALFAGGYSSGKYYDKVDIFNCETGNWTTASLSEARCNLTATSIGKYALFAGGYSSGKYYDKVDIFNCETGNWTTASLSEARWNLTATSIGKYALFAGGYNNSGKYSDKVDIFNCETGNWTTASLSEARTTLAATSIGKYALFAGGINNDNDNNVKYSNKVDIFNCETGNWTTASLSEARTTLAATSIGKYALFAGGYNNDNDNNNNNQYSNRVDIFTY